MKVHEFFHKYANSPLQKRFITLNFNEWGMTTLSTVYKRLTELEDKIRPMRIEEDELLEAVEKSKLLR